MTMNQEEFEQVFNRQIKQSREVLVKKTGEYAHPDDQLRNFRIGAALTGETPEQVIWGWNTKHIVSISDMVQSGEQFTKAQWDEKIGDAINYLILLRAQIFETEVQQTTVNPEDLAVMMGPGSSHPIQSNIDDYGNISRS